MKHHDPSGSRGPSVLADFETGVDALFADDVAADGPGAAVGVYRRGELVFAKGYGLADLESRQPITPQTPFQVASVSKQFTAFAIALLAREDRVDLDADVRDYLPYVPDFGATITVRHLILHTSGLRNTMMLLQLGGQGVEGRATQQQIVNLVARQQALDFPPGTEYSYSNTGYVLLAEIVFAVTGQTLREFTTERIFAPLGMEQTFFVDDVTEIVPRRASSYTKRHDEDGQETGGWARALLNSDNVGDSGLSTTVEDLAAWAANLVAPVVGDAALVEQVCTSGALDDGTPIDYGFGLIRGVLDRRVTVSHTGRDAAFRSVFVHYPDHDLAVAVLANTELDVMGKARSIADLALPGSLLAAKPVPEEDTGADLSGFAGTYVPGHETSFRLEVRDGTLVHCWGSMEPSKLTVRVDGTVDFGAPEQFSFIPVVDAAGDVIGVDIPQAGSGRPQRFRRIGSADAPPDDLSEYAGDYRSPELDITHSLTVEGDGLLAQHLWSNRSVPLARVIADRFESTDALMISLVFRRDVEGRIDHLLLHSRGLRNMRFDRVGDARPTLPTSSTRVQGIWW